jgi:hypothetical protein
MESSLLNGTFPLQKGLVIPFFKMPYLYFIFFFRKLSNIKGKNENNNFLLVPYII